MAEWPGLPYLVRRLKDLPGDTPCAVYPWIPADAESSGLVPGYLVAAADLHLPDVEIPTDDEPGSPPPPPPPPPPEPQIEAWYVATDKGQTLRLRDGAGLKFKIVGQLARGTLLKIQGRLFVDEIYWTHVLEPVQGYVAVDYLSLIHPDPVPPVVETETRYATGSGLRVRAAPDAKSEILGILDFAEAVTVKKGVLVNGANGDTNKWRVRTVPAQGYIADQFLSLERPKVDAPPEPPPSAGRSVFGIFIHEGSPDPATAHSITLDIAREGGLRAVAIVNNKGLANEFARLGVPYVIWRPVSGINDRMPDTHGDERDVAVGHDYLDIASYEGLDRRVYIQPFGTNEQNRRNDGYLWLGIFRRFVETGWLCAAFPDGVGNPGDFRESAPGSNRYLSEAWDLRVLSGAMKLGKQHGFLNTYHGYGKMEPVISPGGDIVGWKETADPASALWFGPDGKIVKRDDAAWFWFGGRALSVYYAIKPDGNPLVPEHSRMKIVSGEYRSSDAIYRNAQEIIDDVRGCDIRTKDDPYFEAVCAWCEGGDGGGPRPNGLYGFAYSTMDAGLPVMKAWRRTYRPG